MNATAAERARIAINRVGHSVAFRRMSSSINAMTKKQDVLIEANVKIVGQGYAIGEIASGVTVGTRKIIVSKLDLEAAGFPDLHNGDRVYLGIDGTAWGEIIAIDAEHREYTGCYDLTVRGK